jgi:chromosome segregation protein
MRIKRIEIIGFKSFCDRSVINIDNPITSIVGPNGCGKSNIVDAIRWCMGEQSAKHLRGKAMDDVIFAGSESRGPASMGEVSLTFDDVGFSHEALQFRLNQVEEGESADDDLAGEGVAGEGVAGEGVIEAPLEGPAAGEAAEIGSLEAQMPEGEAAEAAEGEAAEIGSLEAQMPEGEAAEDAAGEAAEGEVAEGEVAEIGSLEAQMPEGEAAQVEALDVQAAQGAGRVARADGADGADGADLEAPTASEEVEQFLEDRPPAFDFARYSEVTITRRLFRDGTSLYMINKTPCRLRDVTDFFLGTGIGTKAYAIIEQGRIGMIVSARPQDRRALIEEAAGITKFKTKKRAAERKLEQTRQNLLRVSDIVSELQKRMGSLRRQAQKAERYRRYKSEVRDIELWKAAHRYLALRAEQKVLEHTLAECNQGLHNTRIDLDREEARVLAERTEMAIEERRLSSLQETIYELENRIKLSESKIEFQTREARELEERVSAAHSEIQSLRERRTEAAESLDQQRGELEALKEQVAREEDGVMGRETAVSEARQMLHNAQSQLDEARAQLNAARADLVRAESQKEALVRRRDEAGRRLQRVLDDTQVANERLARVERDARAVDKKLADLRQTRFDLGSQVESLQARREHLDEVAQRCEAEVETLRTELHRRKSRLQSLVEIQDKYEGFARGTRAIMQGSDALGMGGRAIRGLVADVLTAPESLEVAVEAALGDRLGGVLVESHDVGVQAVRFLKERAAGRSAFVPYGTRPAPRFDDSQPADMAAMAGLDLSIIGAPGMGAPALEAPGEPALHRIVVEDRTNIQRDGVLGRMVDLVEFDPGFESVGKSLLSECVVVDGLERAIELHQEGLTEILVTLDGDIVDRGGVVQGGSREAQGAGVLAQKREIRQLEEITAGLETDLTDATARLVATKSELQQVTRALEGVRKESHEGDIAIMGHQKDASQCHTEIERLRERLAQLNAEQLELEERIRDSDRESAEQAALHASAIERIERYEREQLGFIQGVTDGRERLEELTHLLTEARIRAAQLGEKRASVKARALQLEAADRDLGERIGKLETSIRDGSERVASLRGDSQTLGAELVGVREDWREKAEAMEQGRSAYELRLADLQVAEVAVRELRTRAERLSSEASNTKLKLGNAIAGRQMLEESIDDRYQIEIAKNLSDYHLRPQVTDAEDKRLAELKRVIERMGTDINLTAIDEFAEVSQRFEFLSTQRSDLESAVGQLETAIAKINKTSRKLFRDTYNAINNQFQEVFPRLFRGGRARLQLTAPKAQEGGAAPAEFDILDAGVEILAQPPGKKNTTVEQLSGGEKALTAVALIFSIFLVKPSPFCILDEVDAPLDDANVDRYNEFVREMTDRSQFIVITHNKRTMEIADSLYGVTMQEPGVSKLVSVNLSKIDERVAA